jgi:hypothetical protein
VRETEILVEQGAFVCDYAGLEIDTFLFFFFFITLGLELSDTQVYEP